MTTTQDITERDKLLADKAIIQRGVYAAFGCVKLDYRSPKRLDDAAGIVADFVIAELRAATRPSLDAGLVERDLLKECRQFVSDAGCDQNGADVNQHRDSLLERIDALLSHRGANVSAGTKLLREMIRDGYPVDDIYNQCDLIDAELLAGSSNSGATVVGEAVMLDRMCRCAHPMIKCDQTGCRCTQCGEIKILLTINVGWKLSAPAGRDPATIEAEETCCSKNRPNFCADCPYATPAPASGIAVQRKL